MKAAEPVFDEVIHAPHRLRTCALLVGAEQVEFGVIRDHLGVADSVASKHLKALSDAGYIELRKPLGQKGRARTWVALTKSGRSALASHLAALQEMVAVATTVE